MLLVFLPSREQSVRQSFFRYHCKWLGLAFCCVPYITRHYATPTHRHTHSDTDCFCNCHCTWLMMATVSCYMHHDGHLTAQVIAWHFVHFEMCLLSLNSHFFCTLTFVLRSCGWMDGCLYVCRKVYITRQAICMLMQMTVRQQSLAIVSRCVSVRL